MDFSNEENKIKISIICVDYQGDFCREYGKWYKERKSHKFIDETIIPFLKKHNIKIAEIISDYRLPRGNEKEVYCIPGTKGYKSEIPEEVKLDNIWIKCNNSPLWVRENGGEANKTAGKPYQNPEAFNKWLIETIGPANGKHEVYLMGLTLDVCVLSLAQELYYRDYQVKYLAEAVDVYQGNELTKKSLLDEKNWGAIATPLNWGKKGTWKELQKKLLATYDTALTNKNENIVFSNAK